VRRTLATILHIQAQVFQNYTFMALMESEAVVLRAAKRICWLRSSPAQRANSTGSRIQQVSLRRELIFRFF
jgi:hypothetical protein